MTAEQKVKQVYPEAERISPEYGTHQIVLRPRRDRRAFVVSNKATSAWAEAARRIKQARKGK